MLSFFVLMKFIAIGVRTYCRSKRNHRATNNSYKCKKWYSVQKCCCPQKRYPFEHNLGNCVNPNKEK